MKTENSESLEHVQELEQILLDETLFPWVQNLSLTNLISIYGEFFRDI